MSRRPSSNMEPYCFAPVQDRSRGSQPPLLLPLLDRPLPKPPSAMPRPLRRCRQSSDASTPEWIESYRWLYKRLRPAVDKSRQGYHGGAKIEGKSRKKRREGSRPHRSSTPTPWRQSVPTAVPCSFGGLCCSAGWVAFGSDRRRVEVQATVQPRLQLVVWRPGQPCRPNLCVQASGERFSQKPSTRLGSSNHLCRFHVQVTPDDFDLMQKRYGG